jgi:hypothetical protein
MQNMPLPTSDQVEKARLKASQARARLQALEARLNEASRKLDTRRKIILGGLLIDAASKDERYAKVVTALMGRIDRDQDRIAFEGWTPPAPAASPAPSPVPADAPSPAASTAA